MPKDKNDFIGIKLYKYLFLGIEKPVTMEARSRSEARALLDIVMPKLPVEYHDAKIVGESVIVPLKGVSSKSVGGKKYIWVGEDKTANGWMEENEYKEIIKKYKK